MTVFFHFSTEELLLHCILACNISKGKSSVIIFFFCNILFFSIKMLLRLLLSLVESYLIIMFLDVFFFLFLCSIFWVLDLCILCFFNLKKFQALFLHILSLSPYLSLFFLEIPIITLILGWSVPQRAHWCFLNQNFFYFFYLDSFFYYVCKLSIILKIFIFISVFVCTGFSYSMRTLSCIMAPCFGSVVP